MKVAEKNYGVQVTFDKEDDPVYYDGTFVSNLQLAFIPTERVRAIFNARKSRASYKAHTPFSVQDHICTSGKCRYNLYDVLSEKRIDCVQEIIATGWVGMSKKGIPTGIYHNRTTNEFVQIDIMYATIIEELKSDTGRIMMENSSGNMALVWRQDELIGGVMLLTFKSNKTRTKIEDIY